MTQRLIPVLLAIVIVAIPAKATVMDSWQDVQSDLSSGDTGGAGEAIRTLQDEAAELDVRRMTPFAAALVAWAEANPGPDGEMMLEAARDLDPEYPSSYILEARWGWDDGNYMDAVRNYVSGWIALFRYEPTRRDIDAWLILWVISAVAVTLLVMIVVVILRHLRGMVYDARSLGGRLFRPANAWVLAVVVVLLPLFAGLGPVWLAVYLFAMSWVYLKQPLRICAFAACLILALLGPMLAWVQHDALKSLEFIDRVGTMLDERQIDFSTLGEYSGLESELDDVGSYHLIFGELLRMHGEPSMAKIQFQKATLLDPDQTRPLLFVANLAMEEGNTKRAIQLYNLVLEKDQRNAYAYQNLSLAFDLSRRFQEGDAARASAREIAGRSSADLGLRGLDPRIRYPRLTSGDVADLVSDMSPDQRLSAGRVGF
jgi:tetratricopeptide (TPR) repeat protein